MSNDPHTFCEENTCAQFMVGKPECAAGCCRLVPPVAAAAGAVPEGWRIDEIYEHGTRHLCATEPDGVIWQASERSAGFNGFAYRLLSAMLTAAPPPPAAADEMVTLLPGLPAIPRRILDAAEMVENYMRLRHPGPWSLFGIQSVCGTATAGAVDESMVERAVSADRELQRYTPHGEAISKTRARAILTAALQPQPHASPWASIDSAPRNRPILISDGVCTPDVVLWRNNRPARENFLAVPEGWFLNTGGRSKFCTVVNSSDWSKAKVWAEIPALQPQQAAKPEAAQGDVEAGDIVAAWATVCCELHELAPGWMVPERGQEWDAGESAARAIRLLASAQPATAKPEPHSSIVGECVAVGSDEDGQPRILIHTTRDAILNCAAPMLFQRVRVTQEPEAGEADGGDGGEA